MLCFLPSDLFAVTFYCTFDWYITISNVTRMEYGVCVVRCCNIFVYVDLFCEHAVRCHENLIYWKITVSVYKLYFLADIIIFSSCIPSADVLNVRKTHASTRSTHLLFVATRPSELNKTRRTRKQASPKRGGTDVSHCAR